MRWREVQQIFIDANESATYICRAVYKVFCFLVNDQLDAQFFYMYLFQLSTCFGLPRAHHQETVSCVDRKVPFRHAHETVTDTE